MNIAICDDDRLMSGQVEKLVDQVFHGETNKYNTEVFFSGDALLAFSTEQPNFFHIYLLDIEMAGTDGLETAAQIRKADSDAVIIFMTSHAELMSEAFEVLAFQFIVKPFDQEKALGILSSAIRYLQKRKGVFQFVAQKKIYTFFLSQISFIESSGRKIFLHTTEGETYEYYGTLKDAREQVKGIFFAQIHNSIIINLEQLRTVESNFVYLKEDEKLPISKKFHATFHEQFQQFVLSR
ncbi:response regulator transcription factor [Enterococcus hulanensis]|uniref:LytR/AlgR family response regulator transcription factor n=1 Tax=Enterococcus hulanensis TaxID=2559929 RepID=UPI001A8CE178|nr:LytTR family DNA-binding domain-containing protein [Enterococcus hulanensis]MBO0456168.1 response regulator transcription factor [Enterococcus hulanensis]